MAGLARFIKNIFMWSLGFVLAGYIFCTTIFYIIPYATGLPVDTSKYVISASRNIEAGKVRQVEHPGPTLSQSVMKAINGTIEYFLQFI